MKRWLMLVPVLLLATTARIVLGDEHVVPRGGSTATPHASPAPDGQGQPVAEPLYRGVIVSASNAPSFIRAFSGGRADGYWTPHTEDVARLEAALTPFLRLAVNGRSPDLWQRLPEYTRQYVGIITGEREAILVNAFCDDLGIDWRTTPVAVLDGGDCFFQVTYDIASGAFSDLMVNGEA